MRSGPFLLLYAPDFEHLQLFSGHCLDFFLHAVNVPEVVLPFNIYSYPSLL